MPQCMLEVFAGKLPCKASHYRYLCHTETHFTTVNSEIFARILFSRIALKDIFIKVKKSRLRHNLPIY